MTTIIHTNQGILQQHDNGTLYLLMACGHRATTTESGAECSSCEKQVDPFYTKTANTDDLDAAAQFVVDAEAFLNNTH